MYTNSELLDTIITQMYDMFKALITGQYVLFTAAFTELMSKLSSLKKGIEKDEKMHRQQVKMLEDQLEAATAPRPTGDGDVVVGGERFEFRAGPHGEIDPADAGDHAIPFDVEGRLEGGNEA